MGAFKLGSLVERVATTSTAGGLTTLANNSPQNQQFTGATTQTVKLPDATTMVAGMRFAILNRSTGSVTVNDGNNGLLKLIVGGSQNSFLLLSNGTVAGTWDVSTTPGTGSGTFANSMVSVNNAASPFALSSTTHNGVVFKVDTSAGAVQLNLPAAVANFIFTVADTGNTANTNNITVHRAAAETIGGVAADYVFAAQGGRFTLMCDGTNYFFVT